MTRITKAILFLCISCAGDAPFTPGTTCEIDGYGGVYFEESGRDCGCAERVINNGRRVLEIRGVIPEEARFPNLTIWFHSGDDEIFKDGPRGRYIPDEDEPRIRLNRYGDAFVHELLHHWELTVLATSRSDASTHRFWEERGWTPIADTFAGFYMKNGPFACAA